MESRQKTTLQQLANQVSEKIIANLTFEFRFADQNYLSISDTLKIMIKNEITSILHIALTDTQQAIVQQTDCTELANAMVGSLTRNENFNITNGDGIEAKGLTKVYFDALSCNMNGFIQAIFAKKHLIDPTMPGPWTINFNNTRFSYATYNILNGDEAARSKAVLLAFSDALIASANSYQQIRLCEELNNPNNITVKSLRKPRGIRGLFTNESSTKSYSFYENTLAKAASYSRLLVTALNGGNPIEQNIPYVDLADKIGLLFNNKEKRKAAKALACVNKTMAAVQQEELEHFKATYSKQ